MVVRDILRPDGDPVRAAGADDPTGGVIDGAADANWIRRLHGLRPAPVTPPELVARPELVTRPELVEGSAPVTPPELVTRPELVEGPEPATRPELVEGPKPVEGPPAGRPA
jgi:hypothetical protein